MRHCVEAVAGKADVAELHKFQLELTNKTDKAVEDLYAGKASTSHLLDLEKSQRALFKEVGAVQQVLACKVDRGEGTLGALVNDPLLYQGMRDVVTGVQDSRFLRWMAQRYARKGGASRAGAGDGD